MTTVRPFQPADLEELRAIMNATIARGDAFVYEVPFTPPRMMEWIETHSCAWVAVSDRRVAGAYVLRPNHPGRGSHIANAAYMVSPELHGQGIGKLLGEHSLSEARRLGFAAMQFNAVVASNESAVGLWRSLGFAVIGTVPRAFRHSDGKFVDLCIMHRDL